MLINLNKTDQWEENQNRIKCIYHFIRNCSFTGRQIFQIYPWSNLLQANNIWFSFWSLCIHFLQEILTFSFSSLFIVLASVAKHCWKYFIVSIHFIYSPVLAEFIFVKFELPISKWWMTSLLKIKLRSFSRKFFGNIQSATNLFLANFIIFVYTKAVVSIMLINDNLIKLMFLL